MINGLVPWMRQAANDLVEYARSRGYAPHVTSVRRTRANQARLYRRYLRGLSPFPAAPPGHSKHEVGRAFDMVVISDAAQRELGRVWRAAGGRWFESDPIHFEA